MDIVLATVFNNPLLPRIPVPGFTDNFNRVSGDPLGFTSAESKPWNIVALTGSPVWQISSDGAASLAAASSGLNVAVVDGMSGNGTLVATAKALGTQRRGGLAFRYQDIDNHLAIYQATSGGFLNLYKRIGGATATSIATSTYTPVDGDVYSVVLAGSSITVKVNGNSIMTATETAFSGATYHGLYGSKDALGMRWDDISFSAT